jgi:phosphatidate phosphatase APP1
MQKTIEQGKERNSLITKIKRIILRWLRLTNDPVVKVYNGYGSTDKLLIFGHAFRLSPLPRKKYRKNIFTNSYGLLRMFMVRPLKRARLKIVWENSIFETHTEDDGFFRFEWKPEHTLVPGWYSVMVSIIHPAKRSKFAESRGDILVPYPYRNTFISDIDDTFLISHSSNLRKRLYVLLTKNARSRKPFESVVEFYQALANSGAVTGTFNPFFYVSSSEWNLYDYINEFSHQQNLPRGVYLLNQLKQFSQVWKTGQNNHSTKFVRITRIIEAYPTQQFVLFGDDSQEDPTIYSALADHFNGKIRAIYIRNVRKASREKVLSIQERLENSGIAFCYFSHSSEAITHAKVIGLTV